MNEKRKDQVRSMVGKAVDTALIPFHAAVSKPAQKAYIGTALFTVTSLFLLLVATVAYWLFYFSYVPHVGIHRVIHLQFGDGPPHGTTPLLQPLASQQPYDITLSLTLPLTPSNLAAGNFMADLTLLPPGPSLTTTNSTIPPSLAHSRRPAILPYTSSLLTTLTTLLTLPRFLLGLTSGETASLKIPMFESVSFPPGRSNVPTSLALTLESVPEEHKMQFYTVAVEIVARLGGVRWVLYHHRWISFLVFTGVFWGVSVVGMVLVWLGLGMWLGEGKEGEGLGVGKKLPPLPLGKGRDGGPGVKAEEEEEEFDPTSLEDLSDTSRTFPTLGRQAPLKFSGRGGGGEGMKEEGGERVVKREGEEVGRLAMGVGVGAEADDEDEGEGEEEFGSEWRDSGLGTSREEEQRRDNIRRRRGSGKGSVY